MQTLKDDLERAIPRPETGGGDLDALVRAGRQSLRRRRARVSGALTAGGLAVAGLGLGVSTMLAPDRPQDAEPSAGSASDSAAPVTTRTPRPVDVELTLASLRTLADSCGGVTLDANTMTLTSEGETVTATDRVRGDGWVAMEYPCDSDVLRILQYDDRAAVARYGADTQGTLEEWAESNVELLRR